MESDPPQNLTPESSKLAAKLIGENFTDWYSRLSLYACSKMRKYQWQRRLAGIPDGGEEGPDVVLHVFQDLMDGKRKWDPEKYPDLLPVLFKMVKSEIWDLSQLVANQVERRPFYDEKGELSPAVREEFIRKSETPLTELQKQEMERICSKITDRLLAEVAEDKELKAFFENYYTEGLAPREIAAKMGLSEKQIDALRKRLDRKLEKIMERDFSEIIAELKGVRK